MEERQLGLFPGPQDKSKLTLEPWLAYAEEPASLDYAQQLVNEELGSDPDLGPEPNLPAELNLGVARLEWIPHQSSKLVQQAYKQLENDNLSLLLEFGNQHLTQVNNRLESQVTEAQTALEVKKRALEDLNQARKREHKEGMDRLNDIEQEWRGKVQSLVDIYITE